MTCFISGPLLFIALLVPQIAGADDSDRSIMATSIPQYNGDVSKRDLGSDILAAALKLSYAFEENTTIHDSWHVCYPLTNWFWPLVKLNHFRVLSAGKRSYADHIASSNEVDLVAAAARFNPCDILNMGGGHNGGDKHLVTMAIGTRFRITQWFDISTVYEFPLMDNEKTLQDDRFMIDVMISF